MESYTLYTYFNREETEPEIKDDELLPDLEKRYRWYAEYNVRWNGKWIKKSLGKGSSGDRYYRFSDLENAVTNNIGSIFNKNYVGYINCDDSYITLTTYDEDKKKVGEFKHTVKFSGTSGKMTISGEIVNTDGSCNKALDDYYSMIKKYKEDHNVTMTSKRHIYIKVRLSEMDYLDEEDTGFIEMDGGCDFDGDW